MAQVVIAREAADLAGAEPEIVISSEAVTDTVTA